MKSQFNRNTCCAAAAVLAAVSTFAITGEMLDRSLDRAYARTLLVGSVEIVEIPPDANVVEDHGARLAYAATHAQR
jgi:hypothetical protein